MGFTMHAAIEQAASGHWLSFLGISKMQPALIYRHLLGIAASIGRSAILRYPMRLLHSSSLKQWA